MFPIINYFLVRFFLRPELVFLSKCLVKLQWSENTYIGISTGLSLKPF